MLNEKILIALSLSVFIAACGGGGEAPKVPTAEPAGESMKDIGDHAVHFNAQLTDELSPEIASAYNIVRSKNRAMLTISVVRDADNASVPARVTVKTVNLTGQLKNIAMRPIEEQDAVYYVGETPVANRETLIFDITVMPEGAAGSSEVRFKREFYTD
ncbi:MAG TPA: DUF4426 domain-containing protein [Woeseiaceae bacterium]|nr:DUF4426 domain-containing protein [Woeseiaceae bacterium]